MVGSLLLQIKSTSVEEWIAVFTAILYLFLAAKENPWCWAAAIVSVSLFFFLLLEGGLVFEAWLQVYYFAMAIYGWYSWTRKKKGDSALSTLKISTLSLKSHLLIIGIGGVLVLGTGFLAEHFQWGVLPYADAFTTWFSVITTWMVTRKILENWLYWVVIDLVSIYLYFDRGFLVSSGLFVFYVVLAGIGFVQWQKEYQKSNLA